MSIALRAHLLSGRGRTGVYSVCSAHPWVIEAAALQAVDDGQPLLLEATSNQVNQDGGYTGMLPEDFRAFAVKIAESAGLTVDQLILGGDHLGPNPWSSLRASEAMEKAAQMVALYVTAGFTKIHLDTSMRCADDPEYLDDATIAERAASLCEAAERAAEALNVKPVYIIGTEVPPPGGATHQLQRIDVTTDAAAERTWKIHQDAFGNHRLDDAWHRVMAIVVQPGVEFDHDAVVNYLPKNAAGLKNFLARHPELVFEAHSTDYQLTAAYNNLIRDGFSILKVGPALTFAMREALLALACIEEESFASEQRSNLRQTLESVVLSRPGYWQRYYHGTLQQQKLLRFFSYSDRIRYYWPDSEVEQVVKKLLANLEGVAIPETLLSQYLPGANTIARNGPSLKPKQIVIEHIRSVLRIYTAACRQRPTPA
jgi:D-tagatose-1,6-bisphosphate aldolase subunit GatZ/KbaZ